MASDYDREQNIRHKDRAAAIADGFREARGDDRYQDGVAGFICGCKHRDTQVTDFLRKLADTYAVGSPTAQLLRRVAGRIDNGEHVE